MSPGWNSTDAVVMKSPMVGSPASSDNESLGGDSPESSRPSSSDDMRLPAGRAAEERDSGQGESSSHHEEGADSDGKSEAPTRRVSIPVINVTEDVSKDKTEPAED